MKHRFTPLLLVSCMVQAGCAGTGAVLRPDDSLAQEVRELRTRVIELQRQAAVNEVELTRLRQQVADLEARAGIRPGTPATSQRPAAEPPRTSDLQLSPEPSRSPSAPPRTEPRPQPQKTAPAPEIRREAPRPAPAAPAPAPRREPAATTPPGNDEIEETDIELPEPETRQPARPPAPPAAARPTPSRETPPASTGGEDEPETLPAAAQALYDRGYTLYHQGHYVDAEGSFQRFLQANPASELADNAQYWIGECRYARGDHRGALAAFRETVERFPKGNKVPDAMLKSGQSLEALGDVEGARVTYREVARRFPGTAAATVAEERRAKLP